MQVSYLIEAILFSLILFVLGCSWGYQFEAFENHNLLIGIPIVAFSITALFLQRIDAWFNGEE